MCRVAIVVLHYETEKDTEECAASLLKYIEKGNVDLIIVDNGSKTGRLERLKARYAERDKIHFIRSEENLGFAKGNNLGFAFAKNHLGAEIIVLANNDLIFSQADFTDRLAERYLETGFDVAGPRIVSTVNGKNQNPVRVHFLSVKDVNKRMLKNAFLYLLSLVNADIAAKKVFSKEVDELEITGAADFQLHGACLFFAGGYVKKYDGLWDKTFMYGEEDILKYIVKKDGMKMLYLDDITVFHKEGASTEAFYGNGKKKRQFFYKWSFIGCRLLKRLMRGRL